MEEMYAVCQACGEAFREDVPFSELQKHQDDHIQLKVDRISDMNTDHELFSFVIKPESEAM